MEPVAPFYVKGTCVCWPKCCLCCQSNASGKEIGIRWNDINITEVIKMIGVFDMGQRRISMEQSYGIYLLEFYL